MTWKFLPLGFPSRKHNPTIFGCKAKGMKWNLYEFVQSCTNTAWEYEIAPWLVRDAEPNMRPWWPGVLYMFWRPWGSPHMFSIAKVHCFDVALVDELFMYSLCKHATSNKFQSQSEQNSIQFEEFKQTHWSSRDWEMLDSLNSICHKIALQTHYVQVLPKTKPDFLIVWPVLAEDTSAHNS